MFTEHLFFVLHEFFLFRFFFQGEILCSFMDLQDNFQNYVRWIAWLDWIHNWRTVLKTKKVKWKYLKSLKHKTFPVRFQRDLRLETTVMNLFSSPMILTFWSRRIISVSNWQEDFMPLELFYFFMPLSSASSIGIHCGFCWLTFVAR